MSSMTNQTEQVVATAMLNGGTYNGGALWVALLTADPGEAGSLVSEVNDTSYNRVRVAAAANDQFTPLDAAGTCSNKHQVTFPAMTRDVPNAVSHVALCKTNNGNDMVVKSALAVPRRLLAGAVPFFDVGEIRINFD